MMGAPRFNNQEKKDEKKPSSLPCERAWLLSLYLSHTHTHTFPLSPSLLGRFPNRKTMLKKAFLQLGLNP
jgi:hypothetical protein